MSACDDSKDETFLQQQQPQHRHEGKEKSLKERAGSLDESVLDGKKVDIAPGGDPEREGVPDHARFTAGIVSLYAAVLKEPIPDRMLRLIEELGKLERKS